MKDREVPRHRIRHRLRHIFADAGRTAWRDVKYSELVSDESDQRDSSEQEEITAWLTDALYTGVGLGVLAINRIQVARRSAEKTLRDSSTTDAAADPSGDATVADNPAAAGMAALSEMLADPDRAAAILERVREELQGIDDRLDGVENRLVEFLDGIEPELPAGARELAAALRSVATDHATQLRAVLGLRVR